VYSWEGEMLVEEKAEGGREEGTYSQATFVKAACSRGAE
jgi:hypothetical protein